MLIGPNGGACDAGCPEEDVYIVGEQYANGRAGGRGGRVVEGMVSGAMGRGKLPDEGALDVPATNIEVMTGKSLKHINGCIGECKGYRHAIDSRGHIGIQAPGKTTEKGPDFITFDASAGQVVVWDAKYRGPGGKYPSSVPLEKLKAWTPEVMKAIEKMPAGPVRDAAKQAAQNGQVVGRIFKYPN